MLIAVQVYEKIEPGALAEVRTLLDATELRVYPLNVPGRNHGILIGTLGASLGEPRASAPDDGGGMEG
jgi:hypothetical protein